MKFTSYGNRIRDIREDNDMKQKDLAEKLCIANNTLSQYENDVRDIDLGTIKNIAEIYHVSADCLLGIVDLKAPIWDEELYSLVSMYLKSSKNTQKEIINLLEKEVL